MVIKLYLLITEALMLSLSLFLSLCLCLCLSVCLSLPSSISPFQMPKIEVCSNARPSLYGYPPLLEKEKGREKEKVQLKQYASV